MKRPIVGFTLIELIVIIATIGVLATITVIGFSSYQRDARDEQRGSNAIIISEALEEYYQKNGEYPSIQTIVNSNQSISAASVSTVLDVPVEVLSMPLSGEPLSITSREAASGDVIIYEAESEVNNENCQTLINAGCDRFQLTYVKESGEEVVIESRQNGAPIATVANAPTQPSLSVSSGGANIVEAESSIPNCDQNAARLVAKYSFRYRINSGAWTQWSNWSTSRVTTVTGTQGQTYEYEVKTRCDDGQVPGKESLPSASDSYTIPLNPPATPTITAALSSTNVVATVSIVSCASGYSAQYSFRTRTNNGTWSSYGTFTSTRTSTVAATQGVRYGFQAQARCTNGTTTSGSATTTEATYTHPFVAPAAVSITASTAGNTTTFTLGTGACPAGGTVQYQTRLRNDAQASTPAWGSVTAAKPTPTSTTTNQGIEYFGDVQVRCTNTYSTSGWSAVATASYLRPITNPSNTTFTITRNSASSVRLGATTTCGTGVSTQHRFDVRIYDRAWPPSSTPSKIGWYRDYHSGWVFNSWMSGNSIGINITDPTSNGIRAGERFAIYVNKRCTNTTTGRTSAEFFQTSTTLIAP